MPCTLEPWEEDYEERRLNKERFGVDITDRELAVRLLCEAAGHLKKNAKLSPELTLWIAAHRARDKEKKRG